MSMPPYSSTARRVISATASSLVTSTKTARARRRPYAAVSSSATSSAPSTLTIGDDDVRAARSEQARGRAADAARAAGDQRDAAGELAARRGLRELVALERPVLDRERLALAERPEAAERVGGVLDGDRTVVEVA